MDPDGRSPAPGDPNDCTDISPETPPPPPPPTPRAPFELHQPELTEDEEALQLEAKDRGEHARWVRERDDEWLVIWCERRDRFDRS